MLEMAPVVFPVDASRAVFTLDVLLVRLALLLRNLLPRNLLPSNLLPRILLAGMLLARLNLPSLRPALPPTLDSLPGLVIGLVVIIQTSVLLKEPTIGSINTVLIWPFIAGLALPGIILASFHVFLQPSLAY